MSIIRNRQLLLDITELYSKDFPEIERRNDYVNSLRQSALIPFVHSHLQLDAAGNKTNWQELLRMPQMRLLPNQMGALRTGLVRSGFKLPETDDAFFTGRFPLETAELVTAGRSA